MKIIINQQEIEFLFNLAQFEITGKCNFNCKHCRASDSQKNDLTLIEIENGLNFVLNNSSDDLRITFSGGEPFLHPHLLELIELIENKKIQSFTITTNGSILNKSILNKLAQSSIPNIQIQLSIDYPNSKDHDEFRQFSGAYEKALKFLQQLNKLKINSSIRSTISNSNIKYMDKLVNLAIKTKTTKIGFGTIIPTGRGKESNLCFSPEQKKQFLIKLINLKKMYPQIEITSEDPLKICIINSPFMQKIPNLNSENIFGGCSAGVTTINIEPDGTITPCSLLKIPITNIKKPLNIIEREYSNSKIIKKLVTRDFSGKCNICKNKRICGGCRAIAHAQGNYLGPDTTCWF